ncbi:MAG TPA: DNA polymerase III subunit beta [Gemmataceae bacterium]
MKAHCHREGLLAAFQLASVAIPARDVKPILRNVKAIAETDRCTLMATDLELGIRLEVRGLKVEEPGEAILPAARLIAILREAQAEEVTIEANADACTVSGPGMEFEMPSEDPANFPDLPTFTDDKYHEITAGPLREMIRRTVFAAADESARYSMTGVLWELEGNEARLVATDGKRLAMTQGAATVQGGHTTKGQTPVVPTKAMALLERNLHDENEVVRVSLRPNEVLFRTERAVIYSRLVEGRYPNYREVFPKKTAVKVPLAVPAFLAAVRQAAVMTDEDSKRVVFHFTKKKLTLEAHGQATGRSKVEVPLEYDGKGLDISFNPAFLVEMLKVLPAEAPLELDLVDGASPALFRSEPNYSYLVMPLT